MRLYGVRRKGLAAEFIPRAQVVTFLRRELTDDPARLRRLVNTVLAEDWKEGLDAVGSSAAFQSGLAGVSNGLGPSPEGPPVVEAAAHKTRLRRGGLRS